MRRAYLFSCGVLTLTFGLFVGCQDTGLSSGMGGSSSAQTQADALEADDPTSDLAAQAAEQAQRIANASSPAPQPPQQIIWRDLASGPQTDTPIEPVHAAAYVDQPQPVAVAHEADTAVATVDTGGLPQADATVAVQPRPSQTNAYNQYIKAIKNADDSNLSKAITAATLGAAGPYGELDWSLLAPLSPMDQERVQRYHKAVTALREQALTGEGRIDQAAVAGKLDEVFGNQPVSIRSIELCEKVLGYGVYDTFPTRSFPAGRDQKMIVYVELDHFKPALRGEGDGYEVRLRQELELYESNGFEVWSHEPVQIVDVSKNQRRDFFVVQLVTLPGQLALGQYHLKVRIYDENAGTRDEISIPIQIIADSTLVKQTGR